MGCVCNQSWHVRTYLRNSWHKLQVAAFAQLAVVGRGSNACVYVIASFTMCERTEQRICIKFCFKIGKTATETYQLLLHRLHHWIQFLPWRHSPSGPRPPHCRGFIITLRHTTLSRTPLDWWSARRRDLYMTTHNTHKRLTSMPPGGIRNHNASKRAAADPRLRPHGHYDRH